MKLSNLRQKKVLTTGEFLKKYNLKFDQSNFTKELKENKEVLMDVVKVYKKEGKQYDTIEIINEKKLFKIIKGEK